jgi:deoxyribodipyrimidine photo-lyase
MNTGLYIFNKNCRVFGNEAFSSFTKKVDKLICLYIFQPQDDYTKRYSQTLPSEAQLGYLNETLKELNDSLGTIGQTLIIEQNTLKTVIEQYQKKFNITHVGSTEQCGYNENKQWCSLKNLYTDIEFSLESSGSLFTQSQLPFALNDFPKSFTSFRKKIEKYLEPSCELEPCIPAQNQPVLEGFSLPNSLATAHNAFYKGGEQNAQQHLREYFSSRAPMSYKNTRNALDGDTFSSKMSPFLAHGAISPKQIVFSLKKYEASIVKNESTYWIYFELLWREYFYWYAKVHGSSLFNFSGIAKKKPLTSFYSSHFHQWCNGRTGAKLVNALMNELNLTGWMSNRGRQIVASYLVNELQVDWRFGAAYFQMRLIDYDVASNWGNWQYIAGVGSDPRGGRHFNIQKQTDLYDPNAFFIQKWHADNLASTDNRVNIDDWPITT